jgi:hypothetical protein
MTQLKTGRPLVRETATIYHGRNLIVELYPSYVTIREKGRRFRVDVDYRAVLEVGFKQLHREEMARRAAAAQSKHREYRRASRSAAA